jgi:hypothetical protein
MAKTKTLGIASPDASWETQRDLETLIECERIEKDPKRLAKVQALAKQKMLETAAIAAGEST